MVLLVPQVFLARDARAGEEDLVWSTYLGGRAAEDIYDVAVDDTGAVYVVGSTNSENFPTTAGAFDRASNGGRDAFVAKFHPDGSSLEYSLFLGGYGRDYARSVAVDAIGAVYIAGKTDSPNFPTTSGAFDTTYNGGFDDTSRGDAFVTKISPNGSSLVYSTYIGGEHSEGGQAIAIDADGCAYLTGMTASYSFPVTAGAFDESLNVDGSRQDAFVTKLGADGSTLVYSTFLGGATGIDGGGGIAVDADGHAYVAGATDADDFPTTEFAFDTTRAGRDDAFVTKLAADGSALVYSTFLGGGAGRDGAVPDDGASDIAVDGSGHVYVVGVTSCTDFPTTEGAFDTTQNDGEWTVISHFENDVFVTKVAPDGSSLVYSTYLGGNNWDSGNGIAVDDGGAVYVTGTTYSSDFPATGDAFAPTLAGDSDAYAAKLSEDGSSVVYATYLGGTGGTADELETGDAASALALDGEGAVYVAGWTFSPNFPTTPGAFQREMCGNGLDSFLTKLDYRLEDPGVPDYLASMEIDLDRPYPWTDGPATFNVTGEMSDGQPADLSGAVVTWSLVSGVGVIDADTGVFESTQEGDVEISVTVTLGDVTLETTELVQVVDPVGEDDVIVWSTLLGGGDDRWADSAKWIEVDQTGAVYVTGRTHSEDFPTTEGAFDTAYNGDREDIFVAKLTPDGADLVYGTYLGGSSEEDVHDMAIDDSGAVYITVYTSSDDFPRTGVFTTRGVYDTRHALVKLTADGSGLVYSAMMDTYGHLWSVAVDDEGCAYITGTATSNFPTTPAAFDTTADVCADTPWLSNALVAKLNADGSELVYSTFLGPSSTGTCIAVDATGAAYVAGSTSTTEFPTTPGAFDTEFNGGLSDIFVAKLNPEGSELVYSTSMGSVSRDSVDDITLDETGCVYLTGWTLGVDFPTTPGAFQRVMDVGDYYAHEGFVAKLSADATQLIYSTFLGGTGTEDLHSIAVDHWGDAYVTGTVRSDDFPTTPGALDRRLETHDEPGEAVDGFMSVVSADGSQLLYSTYLGGETPREEYSFAGSGAYGVAVDATGVAYIAGATHASDFPVTAGAFQTTPLGYGDGFVMKFSLVADTDGDGLPDDVETNTGVYVDETDTGTDPNDLDTDGDGLPDGWEVYNDLDPNDDTGDNGADGDPDGDGHTNEDEYDGGTDPQDETSMPPTAVFSASATSGNRPLTVDFTDESTDSITSWEWDFGDGYTSTEQNPSHTYYFPGEYTVTLTVTGTSGHDSGSTVIHVDQALPAEGSAYKAVIDGVKVTYTKPTCLACYNDLQDSLLIAVWGDEPGVLTVVAKEDAPLYWGDNCDIVIDALNTHIKKINLKGREETQLYVCGQVGYVKNFMLKDGYVGNTLHYGEDFGLGSDALDPPKKVLIKRGAATAPLFALEYPELRLIPASVEEALTRLEMEIKLKSKPFVESEVGDDEYEYDEDEDIKLAELEFAEVEARVETKAAYVTEVYGVKVRYTKPGCAASYNDDDSTLTIQITESGGDLLVKCGEEAYVAWGDYCDLLISAPDASINTVILKGNLETQLHVVGNVGYVNNFKLKYGCVGDTQFYGEEIGLGCTSLELPNKILIQWGWTTAPVLGVSY
jgi:hypothetical protein